MSKSLNDRIDELEKQLKELQHKLDYVSDRAEEKSPQPTSQIGQIQFKHGVMPSSGTGLGRVWTYPGHIVWNDADNLTPPYGTQPADPNKGYNKHSHSRYAGGALDIHTLELVEYETSDSEAENPVILDYNGVPVNKHCQAYWKDLPNIAKADDGTTDKIGMLDIEFDEQNKKWVTGASMVDVERTYLVQYIWKKDGGEVSPDTPGAEKSIKTDSNGNEMKSSLLYTSDADANENLNKSNVIWDEDAQSWRFYSVFKPYFELEE